MPHLDEGHLTALLDGELTAAERAETDAHLASCAECRQLLDEARVFYQEADALIETLQVPGVVPNRRLGPELRETPALRPELRTSEPSGRRGDTHAARRAVGWAASIVLAVGFGWYASEFGSRGPRVTPLSDAGTARAEETAMTLKSADPRAMAPVDSSPTPATVSTESRARDKAALSSRTEAETRPPASPTAAPSPEPGTASNQAASRDQLAQRADSIPEERRRGAVSRTNPQPTRAASTQPDAPGMASPGAARFADAVPPRNQGGVRTVTLEEAVKSLGGTIRLIDGMVPARVELMETAGTGGGRIRVVYLDPPGRELWLDQGRAPLAGASIRELDDRPGFLAGDTMAVAGPEGSQTLTWVDQTGLRLGLTGFLPADSLRGLSRRVR